MSKYDCCPRYWRGCFDCPEFMRYQIFFCRRANRVRYGVEVVPLEEERTVKASMRRGAWWNRGFEDVEKQSGK